MKLILELCVMLFYARSISSATVKLTNKKVNVDEFLKTVMDSEKFDEIAEKIADKAVEKFSKLKNIGMTAVPDLTLDGKYAYRVSEVDTKDLSDSESKHDKTETEIPTTQRYKNNIGKIDNEAFIKKESGDFSEHLSLKYSQFTKSVHGTRPRALNEKQQMEGEGVGISKEIIEDQYLEEENKQYEDKSAGTKTTRDESDVTKPTLKTKATTDRATNLNKLNKKKNIEPTTPQEQDDSERSNEKDSQHIKENKSMPASEQKVEPKLRHSRSSNKDESEQVRTDGSFESDSLHKEDIKNNEEIKSSEYKIRQPAYEYLKLPDLKKDLSSEEISEHATTTSRQPKSEKKVRKNFSISRVSNKQAKPKKSKLKRFPVREERNRLYTFEKSPDYDDYHQIRIQNQRKKKTYYR